MGKIEIHDGVTKREMSVPSLQGTISVHVNEGKIVLPPDLDVEIENTGDQ